MTAPKTVGEIRSCRAVLGDDQLLAAAIEQQEWAWEALLVRYTGMVDSITWSFRLRGADAAEVRQQVWMLLLENIDRIRQPECIAGWIRAVTRCECLRRQERYRQEIFGADHATVPDESDNDVVRQILVRERRVALRRALISLPGRGRVLLETLLEEPELSYEEVALKLDMPIGSIGPTRQRCLDKLRTLPELAKLVVAQ